MSQLPVQPAPNTSVPVSKTCPQCGGGEYSKTKSKRWIAFGDDRICSGCNIQYAPPTPLWAALLFVPLGLVLTAVGLLLLVGGTITLLKGRPDALGLGLGAGLLIVGPAATIHGIRALIWQGKI